MTKDMTKRIALVTPLKNEINNIDRLIHSITNQSISIYLWIIVENDSDDGSAEKLELIKNVKNVEHFVILPMKFEDKEYKLGTKYSTIINYGFDFLKNQSIYNTLDYIGILDSDCFPQNNYYERLTSFMEQNKNLGISSGLTILESGAPDLRSKSWVRGNCRLWKKECLDNAGYIIGPSADTLSVSKAIINGWSVYPTHEVFVVTRDLGERVNFKYYGSSAYFRGHTLFYALLKSMFLISKGKASDAFLFFKGFIEKYINKEQKIKDQEILNFYRFYMVKKIMIKFKRS